MTQAFPFPSLVVPSHAVRSSKHSSRQSPRRWRRDARLNQSVQDSLRFELDESDPGKPLSSCQRYRALDVAGLNINVDTRIANYMGKHGVFIYSFVDERPVVDLREVKGPACPRFKDHLVSAATPPVVDPGNDRPADHLPRFLHGYDVDKVTDQ